MMLYDIQPASYWKGQEKTILGMFILQRKDLSIWLDKTTGDKLQTPCLTLSGDNMRLHATK